MPGTSRAREPPPRPKVTLFMSISLNGMIARPDGAEDFFTSVNWTAFVDIAKAQGTMVWGRRTHEIFRGAVVEGHLGGVRGFVLTTDRTFRVEEGWAVATSPEEAVRLAAKAGAKEMLVVGGATVNAAFARAGLIDRVVLDIEAVLVGEGKPLFAPGDFDLPLELRDVKRLSPTVLQVHYDVHRHDHGPDHGDAHGHAHGHAHDHGHAR